MAPWPRMLTPAPSTQRQRVDELRCAPPQPDPVLRRHAPARPRPRRAVLAAGRGHNLAWWSANPTWLTTLPYSRDQLIAILHDHITTVVGRYKGKVAQWDVVNEPLSRGFWSDNIGPEYIDMAFRWAHEADP